MSVVILALDGAHASTAWHIHTRLSLPFDCSTHHHASTARHIHTRLSLPLHDHTHARHHVTACAPLPAAALSSPQLFTAPHPALLITCSACADILIAYKRTSAMVRRPVMVLIQHAQRVACAQHTVCTAEHALGSWWTIIGPLSCSWSSSCSS